MKFTYKTQLRLHDTDAAGILFFANQFKFLHDAYEHVLEKMGFSFQEMLTKRDYFLPIVHAESDYKMPLYVGDKITVTVTVAHIGTTSFSFAYEIRNTKKQLVGTGKTVHVTINKKTHTKIPLPKECRQALEKFAK